MSNANTRIKARDRDTIIQALNAGVVPSSGLHHIQVGRAGEIAAIIKDMDRVVDGGAAFRVIVGTYGSGKTFFLKLIRTIALEKKLVATVADLSPERRLYATGGQARSLYSELVRNMATRSKPQGGALRDMLENFVAEMVDAAHEEGKAIDRQVRNTLRPLLSMNFGPAYVDVIEAYVQADEDRNDAKKDDALRWLQGEFTTRTDARKALAVREIITDAQVYDGLKVLAKFAVIAGYNGLYVAIDELVNLYKMQSKRGRDANYEQILRMLNDVLQSGDGQLAIALGGTPEFLLDTRRGLYSYEALERRLAENRFATDQLVDLSGPVIRLPTLTQEELYVLLKNIRRVFASGDEAKNLIPDEAIEQFMAHCHSQIGAAYFQTPSSSIKAFVHMLSILEQNPGTDWHDLIGAAKIEDESVVIQKEAVPYEISDGETGDGNDDELTQFRI